jgi:hypothetical protein
MVAFNPITTPVATLPWRDFDAHLVVLGLAFLEGNALTIDIDEQRLWVESPGDGNTGRYSIPKTRVLGNLGAKSSLWSKNW